MIYAERKIRNEICEIGRRVYARGFAAGNDGNISYRLSDDLVVCTPTLICKGFMTTDDLCTVDLDGHQLFGRRRRTSEILLHLEIYRGNQDAKAVVHAHPPHATAFAITHEEIPSGVLPEIELFLGVVPRAEYKTPGTSEFAASIRPFIGKANTVVLSNHGTVSWAPTLEQAYWHTEMLDTYCRVLILAKLIGNVERISPPNMETLQGLRETLGRGAEARRQAEGGSYVNPDFGAGPRRRP
ncbi:MAG: class II aldolase/adducin family protein [Phycisphaerae bacterium]|nr:class II aldolase/adducin family protein [Phycisphaerae bacterium]